jgi:hypothetical protein
MSAFRNNADILCRQLNVAFDPEQKSAVVGFRGNRIQVIAGRPWRSTTDAA